MQATEAKSGLAGRCLLASDVEHGTEAGQTSEEQVQESRTTLRNRNLTKHLLWSRRIERFCIEPEA